MAETKSSELKVSLPSDKQIAMSRTFDAPREGAAMVVSVAREGYTTAEDVVVADRAQVLRVHLARDP